MFLFIDVICINRGVSGIGCCINWIGFTISIIRSLRRIISLMVRVVMVVRLIFCRLRFVFISFSNGNLLIFDDWEWRFGSVSWREKKDRIGGYRRNLFQIFGLKWINLFMMINFIFSDDLLQFFCLLVMLIIYSAQLTSSIHQFVAFNADISLK